MDASRRGDDRRLEGVTQALSPLGKEFSFFLWEFIFFFGRELVQEGGKDVQMVEEERH